MDRRTGRAGDAGRGWSPFAVAVVTLLTACGPGADGGTGAAPFAQLQRALEAGDERAGAPVEFTVVGSAAKVRPGVFPTDGAPSVLLRAARNEFESFQLVMRSSVPELSVESLNVTVEGPLRTADGSEIPASRFTLYRVGYYNVVTASDQDGSPGRWPDPLIPAVDTLYGERRNAFPTRIPVGENRVAWVDVHVPPATPAGRYEGALLVTTSAQPNPVRVPIAVDVLNLELPSTPSLRTAFGASSLYGCEEFGITNCSDIDVRTQTRTMLVRMALDNRITLSAPQATHIESASGLAVFRRHLLPFLKGQGGSRLAGARLTTFQTISPKARRLPSWRALAEAEGFADRAFAYVCDEPHFFPVFGDSLNNWKYCEAELDIADRDWPAVSKLVTAHIQSSEEAGATNRVDIMVLNVELLDGPNGTIWFPGNQRPLYETFLSNPSRPKALWLYAACGSHGCTKNNDPYTRGWAGYEIDAPASQTRAFGWLAFRYGLSGLLYFDTIAQLSTAWEDQYEFTGNGEGNLFYPGTPSRIGGQRPVPVESLRLKLMRDGIEDYELLRFLENNGRAEEAYRIARELYAAPYRTSRTDAEVQAARLALTRAVEGLVGQVPRPTEPSLPEPPGLPDVEEDDSAPEFPGPTTEPAGDDDDVPLPVTESEAQSLEEGDAVPELTGSTSGGGLGCSSAGSGAFGVASLLWGGVMRRRRRKCEEARVSKLRALRSFRPT